MDHPLATTQPPPTPRDGGGDRLRRPAPHRRAPASSPSSRPAPSPAKLPSNCAQSNPHRYESLTRLLERSGASPAHGDGDDESRRRLSVDDGSLTASEAEGGRRRGGGGRVRCCGRTRYVRCDSPCAVLGGMLGIGGAGTLLGLAFPSSSDEDEGGRDSGTGGRWGAASNALGYTYFLAWTLSFYPQIVTNCRHPEKARRGVSLDFVVWNVVGFACYAAYTTSFRYSEEVRREYAERFGHGDEDGEGDGAGAGNGLGNVTTLLARAFLSGNAAGDDAIAEPQVKANDVAFAWHALALTVVTFVQIACCGGKKDERNSGEWVEIEGTEEAVAAAGEGGLSSLPAEGEGEDFAEESPDGGCDSSIADELAIGDGLRPTREDASSAPLRRSHSPRWTRRLSSATKCVVPLLVATCVAGAIAVACDAGGKRQWIDYLYFLSFVKVGVSVVKYVPQVMLNYRRKSTAGWQIWNILLDFAGGTLSVAQLVGDSVAEARARGIANGGGWTGIAGNPAKLGLGLVSISFDVSGGRRAVWAR
ncbi:hypothetical protein ACHAWF_012771 [Thalassiosira exigua]